MNTDQIHWFSIINSLMIVLILSGMVVMIMTRTLYRDIANYNHLETQDEAQKETGWELVHGVMFRAPFIYFILGYNSGNYNQILKMTLVIMIFTLLGVLVTFETRRPYDRNYTVRSSFSIPVLFYQFGLVLFSTL